MAAPDFLIIGAMKCGTSTLQAQLAAQPGIFMTTPKEPNYFSDDAIFARGEAWYSGLFDGAAPGDLTGEASTHYTKLPTYPDTLDRMAARLDRPRFIYLMRDPLERAISHYIHDWSQGLLPDDPVAAFESTPELAAYSRYGMQLAPFVSRYGRDSILLLRLEWMQADPQGTLSRVGDFLGKPNLRWNAELGAQNVSAERVRRLPMHGLIVDNPVAKALRRSLVPKAVRTRIREGRQMRGRPDLPERLRARLEGIFAEDRAHLAELFPGDPAVDFEAAP
ncbi:sulfotransferase family protein [Tropicimonas aquimaris]|uniref:Sulfotransferase family protein n=1 Tax=Tropicimonas aquimaris TaxID=914152 RepID=A0ABW3IKX8_9RHOB